jgi:GGDEF domain-containing protein
MIKWEKTVLRKLLEIFILILVLYLANLFVFPGNPGYFNGSFNPYSALALLAAAYYGKFYGFLTFILSMTVAMIPLNRDLDLLSYWKLIWDSEGIALTVQLVGVYIFGLIRDSYEIRIGNYRKTARKEVSEKFKFKKEAEALAAVNQELEERVLRQTEAVTSLYTQIKALHSRNLTETLNVLLQTVHKFSWAEKASIWQYDQASLKLVMIANIGWTPEDLDNTILDAEETIEGWSYRNNKIFSVRMLLEYENLMKMDRKRNIFTFPINFSGHSWGILNIEEMPFTKYNLYVEKILSILIDLSAPEIERAVEYESLISYDEINPHTGLPAYTQFYNLVENNMAKAGSSPHNFSIILLEVLNFTDLTSRFQEDPVWKLLNALIQELMELSGNKIDFFHYKETNQLAVFYPDIDYDGVSMFCLETLGVINNGNWKIHNEEINIEAILGFSSSGNQNIPVQELFNVAENLLEMQKV